MATFSRDTTGDEVVKALHDQVTGKTIVITGASVNGLGAETALSLAKASPAQLVLLGRSASKIEPVIRQINEIDSSIKADFVPIVLDDYDSVRKAAEEVNEKVKQINILINNAGIMFAKDFSKNKTGIELQFATNHVGHFLFTALLYQKILLAGAGSRIINLSSEGYKMSPVRFGDYNFKNGQEYNGWAGYGQSKTANILFSRQLASKMSAHNMQAFSVHPGGKLIFSTSLSNHVDREEFNSLDEVSRKYTGKGFEMEPPKSIQQGVSTTLVAALDPRIAGKFCPLLEQHTGSYLVDCKPDPASEYAMSLSNAQKLWDLSEELVGERFEL